MQLEAVRGEFVGPALRCAVLVLVLVITSDAYWPADRLQWPIRPKYIVMGLDQVIIMVLAAVIPSLLCRRACVAARIHDDVGSPAAV
jgi:hypothetical protein